MSNIRKEKIRSISVAEIRFFQSESNKQMEHDNTKILEDGYI